MTFLNTLYTTLDHLTAIHQVLKIETIGDSYFVASGLIDKRLDHAELLANMAFDMDYILSLFKCRGLFQLQLRIGMHAGRVIAGVVGLKVPRYHLFGDCVTVASLMESTGVPGKIQVSDTISNKLQNKLKYVLELRSDEDKEGKRKNMRTWFLYPNDSDIEIIAVQSDRSDSIVTHCDRDNTIRSKTVRLHKAVL